MTETLVLVGTAKGLFTLRSDDGRTRFEVAGPALTGEEVYATCIDTRGDSPRLFAGSVSMHWGPIIRRSDDLGTTWTEQDHAALSFHGAQCANPVPRCSSLRYESSLSNVSRQPRGAPLRSATSRGMPCCMVIRVRPSRSSSVTVTRSSLGMSSVIP